MSSCEQLTRSPMASRRVRRHTMGISNAHSNDDSTSSTSRSTVSLVLSDRLVKVPQRDRPLEPAARETRVEDRSTVARVHDKLFKTHRERFVHKVLRSYDPDGSGYLSPEQLRAALDRLHVGLDPGERDRIVARVTQEPDNRVHYLDFLRSLEVPQPLGGEAVAVARGTSLPGPPTVRPGGGGSGVGDGGTSYWNWRMQAPERIPGVLESLPSPPPSTITTTTIYPLGPVAPASTAPAGPPDAAAVAASAAASDALVTGLLAGRLNQARDKLRAVFRRLDADRNSRIDLEEFAKGLAALRIPASRPQIERLFREADVDGDGLLDYQEWAARFDEHGREMVGQDAPTSTVPASTATVTITPLTAATTAATITTVPPLTQTLGLSDDEVYGALRQPLVLELARNLYGKATGPSGYLSVFQLRDLPRSGRLGLGEMTAACQALVPGLTDRQVASLVAALDPCTTGSVDYRAFVSGLVDGGLVHPRQTHSAPPGGPKAGGPLAGGAAGGGTLGRFGEPLTVPEALPSPHTRALSAVGFSRTLNTSSQPPPGPQSEPGNTTTTTTSTTRQPPLNASTNIDSTPNATVRQRVHDIAVAPLLESLSRSGVTLPPSYNYSTDSDDEGGGASSGAEGAFAVTAPGAATSAPLLASSAAALTATGGGGGGGGGSGTGGGSSLPRVVVGPADVDSRQWRLEVQHAVQQHQRQLQRQRRKEDVTAGVPCRTTVSAGSAPSHATGRFSRFWNHRYADTTYLTSAVPSSAMHGSQDAAHVRKGENNEFLHYQHEDRVKEARRREQLVRRYAARSEFDSHYSAQDDASASDAGRIERMKASRRRHEERCEMYDRLRQIQTGDDHTFFGRLPAFHEHKLDGPNSPNRVYW